jgi:hypothetical protein
MSGCSQLSREKSLVPKCSGKPSGSADVQAKSFLKRHLRVRPQLLDLHDCSGCFRLERLPGGACTHWKAPPFHGARHLRTLCAAVSPKYWSVICLTASPTLAICAARHIAEAITNRTLPAKPKSSTIWRAAVEKKPHQPTLGRLLKIRRCRLPYRPPLSHLSGQTKQRPHSARQLRSRGVVLCASRCRLLA